MTMLFTTPPCKLAIVGASARAAAFSALRAGCEVVTADLFADADLARHCAATRVETYPEGLATWLASSDCDAWAYTGALENYPKLVDRMAAMRPLLGNCGDALRGVRNPLMLQQVLSDVGIAFPETLAMADGLPWDGSWLCKTYRGSSGSGTWRLDGAAARDRAQRERAVFQRFVHGQAAAAIYACAVGCGELLGVTSQLLDHADDSAWRYAGSIGPLALAGEAQAQLARLAGVLANRLGLQGVVGVDFVLTEAGCEVVEINPRYTASVEIVERIRATATAARRWHAKRIIYAPRDAAISQSFHDWGLAQSSLDIAACDLADIPAAGERIPAGRPVLTAFAAGDSDEDCRRGLADRVAEVVRRLYDG
jgi:predicted ATP-grasp superfamily ATP-dependent carboligase